MNECFKCVYRGEVPGSTHSCCNHPATAKIKDSPLLMLASMLGGGHMPPIKVDGIKVVGDPHGIRNGWFGWPLNFDPVWLRECDGFKQKDAAA